MILLEKGLALDKLFICLPYKVADFFLLCDTNMDINGGMAPDNLEGDSNKVWDQMCPY